MFNTEIRYVLEYVSTRREKLECGSSNGTKYPQRQPIQTPQVMCAKPFYLTVHTFTDRGTDGQGDSSIPP